MGVDATFGSLHCMSARMSLSEGIVPDVGTLTFSAAHAARIPAKADLVLRDGRGGSVTIKDVYRLEGTTTESANGQELSVQVADRRCLWQWARVSEYFLEWNAQLPDGTFDPEKSLPDLINDCVRALTNQAPTRNGALPTIFPAVRWDVAGAAQALQDLCSQHALAVTLTAAGQVWVLPAFSLDPAWPGGPCEQIEEQQTGLVKPAKIVILGARTVEEWEFEDLEPVGQEIDGTVRLIDDLSYTPAHGWEKEPSPFMNLVAGTYNGDAYTAAEAQELARKCIWKWYAMTDEDDRELLPLLDTRSTVVKNQGADEHGKPFVTAENAWWDGTTWKKHAPGRISTGFSIDNQAGIVKFDDLVYTVSTEGGASGDLVAPSMKLQASFETVAYYTYVHAIAGGEPDTEYVYRMPELREWSIFGISQNKAELDAVAAVVAARLAEQFAAPGPQSRSYPRIIAVNPEGTLRSVQWSVDPVQGATTVLHKIFELPGPDSLPGYEEKLRRRSERVLLGSYGSRERVAESMHSLGEASMRGGPF